MVSMIKKAPRKFRTEYLTLGVNTRTKKEKEWGKFENERKIDCFDVVQEYSEGSSFQRLREFKGSASRMLSR